MYSKWYLSSYVCLEGGWTENEINIGVNFYFITRQLSFFSERIRGVKQ